MIKKILSMFCAAALVPGLAACASTDEAVPQKYNEPRFNADGIVNLKVNKVESFPNLRLPSPVRTLSTCSRFRSKKRPNCGRPTG